MPSDDVLASRLALLRGIVRRGFSSAPEQVQGFAIRTLAAIALPPDEAALFPAVSLNECLNAAKFGGYPSLARSGFCLAAQAPPEPSADTAQTFLDCLLRQRDRPAHSQAELGGDAIALLGIADALRAIGQASRQPDSLADARSWLSNLLDQHGASDLRLNRMRLLAADLIDGHGRLGRHLAYSDDPRSSALDLCLWRTWRDALRTIEHPDTSSRRELFKRLLGDAPPAEGEVLAGTTWICALDLLTDDLAAVAVPDAHQVARILAATQGSFRRWRWESKPTRANTMPARWLIDKEADIQALLLAILYPYFGDQLEDEQYLQGFGLRQGRFDFAITSLGLIVEVKVLRSSADINNLEGQIADDLSLYFKAGNPFESMIIYIYDDRDSPEPEKYPAIGDALKRRSERIVDVVIVQRPSMIPERGERSE